MMPVAGGVPPRTSAMGTHIIFMVTRHKSAPAGRNASSGRRPISHTEVTVMKHMPVCSDGILNAVNVEANCDTSARTHGDRLDSNGGRDETDRG